MAYRILWLLLGGPLSRPTPPLDIKEGVLFFPMLLGNSKIYWVMSVFFSIWAQPKRIWFARVRPLRPPIGERVKRKICYQINFCKRCENARCARVSSKYLMSLSLKFCKDPCFRWGDIQLLVTMYIWCYTLNNWHFMPCHANFRLDAKISFFTSPFSLIFC